MNRGDLENKSAWSEQAGEKTAAGLRERVSTGCFAWVKSYKQQVTDQEQAMQGKRQSQRLERRGSLNSNVVAAAVPAPAAAATAP